MKDFIHELNDYGANKVPFFFLVDFEMQKPLVFRIDEIPEDRILYDINGKTNYAPKGPKGTWLARSEEGDVRRCAGGRDFVRLPPEFDDYKKKFETVWSRLVYGDSYLTNLTIRTEVEIPCTLKELFHLSRAKYKLWFGDSFLVFSPEAFVRIKEGIISSYPMKGTIDAGLPDARQTILSDPKEMAEHVTIVDLIRNDLSTVADNVEVTRFRYIEEIRTMQKNLLQVSSQVVGRIASEYQNRFGDILMKLLPAGSVSGAPKCKTLDIIRTAESEPRGYYTGVFGLYDGSTFDSGVMIRFLENDRGKMYYRSGGGITVQSSVETEYQEAIDKVYVPFD